MAKRAKPVDELFQMIARLPWWVGIGAAVVSYLVLHSFAGGGAVEPPPQPGQMGVWVAKGFVKALAYHGQYLLPIIFVAGAVASAWGKRKRQTLVTNAAQTSSVGALDGMSWREFEMLVGEAFRLQGYRVVETGGGGADGGVDLLLTKGSERFLVQCKQWKAYKVGVEIVRELYGVMAARGAAGGFVVTSGSFTADASAFADGRNVKLIDGPRLFDMIKQARQSAEIKSVIPKVTPLSPTPAEALQCPSCGSAMVKRLAQKGANAGTQFWGCSTYPKCRATRGAARV